MKYGAFPPGLRFYECILDRDLILASDKQTLKARVVILNGLPALLSQVNCLVGETNHRSVENLEIYQA